MKLTEYTDKDGRTGYKTGSGNLITPNAIDKLKEISNNLEQRHQEAEENLQYLKLLVKNYKK